MILRHLLVHASDADLAGLEIAAVDMNWKQLDPKEAFGIVWQRHEGAYTLQVFGDEKSWAYTIARHRIIVSCVAFAAESPEKAMELADRDFSERKPTLPP